MIEKLKKWWERLWCQHEETEFVRHEAVPLSNGDARYIPVFRCKKCGWEFL